MAQFIQKISQAFGALLVLVVISTFGIDAQMSEEQAAKIRAFNPEWYVTHDEFGRTPSEVYAEILAKINDPNHTPDLGDITAEDLQPYLGEWQESVNQPGLHPNDAKTAPINVPPLVMKPGYIFVIQRENQEYVLKFRVLKKMQNGLLLQVTPVFYRIGEGHMHSALKLWEGQGIWYWAFSQTDEDAAFDLLYRQHCWHPSILPILTFDMDHKQAYDRLRTYFNPDGSPISPDPNNHYPNFMLPIDTSAKPFWGGRNHPPQIASRDGVPSCSYYGESNRSD